MKESLKKLVKRVDSICTVLLPWMAGMLIATILFFAISYGVKYIFNISTNFEGVLKDRYAESIYKVKTVENGSFMATAFYLEYKDIAYAITNAHVCDGQEKLILSQPGVEIIAKIQKIDYDKDLCMLYVPKKDIWYKIKLNANVTASKGYIIGFPAGLGLNVQGGMILDDYTSELAVQSYEPPVYQKGKEWFVDYAKLDLYRSMCTSRSKLGRAHLEMIWGLIPVCFHRYYLIATSIQGLGGNSGSPAIDNNGNLIGVLNSGGSEASWSFLIKIQDLIQFLD